MKEVSNEVVSWRRYLGKEIKWGKVPVFQPMWRIWRGGAVRSRSVPGRHCTADLAVKKSLGVTVPRDLL